MRTHRPFESISLRTRLSEEEVARLAVGNLITSGFFCYVRRPSSDALEIADTVKDYVATAALPAGAGRDALEALIRVSATDDSAMDQSDGTFVLFNDVPWMSVTPDGAGSLTAVELVPAAVDHLRRLAAEFGGGQGDGHMKSHRAEGNPGAVSPGKGEGGQEASS